MSFEDLKVEEGDLVKEITKLIVEGKVKLNKIINAVVSTIVPEQIPAKKERSYNRVKEGKAPKGRTKEERLAYAREYYKKNKDKFKEHYQKNRDILNENGKKYYKLKKLKKIEESVLKNEGLVKKATELRSAVGELKNEQK